MAVVSEEIRKRNFHAHGSDFTAQWVGSLHIARGQGGQEEKRASARWGVHDATRGLRPRTPLFNSRFAFATRYKIGDFLDRTRANATNLPESQILKA